MSSTVRLSVCLSSVCLSSEFGKPALQKTICGGSYARVYCRLFLVRVQCPRKESSRSLSHLLMSFLLFSAISENHYKSTLLKTAFFGLQFCCTVTSKCPIFAFDIRWWWTHKFGVEGNVASGKQEHASILRYIDTLNRLGAIHKCDRRADRPQESMLSHSIRRVMPKQST